MGHRSRRYRKKWPCGHRGFGKYCHFCKDRKAGRPVGVKKPTVAREAQVRMRTVKRARCPFCGGRRVKRNDLNVMSAIDAAEYSCRSPGCGKDFNEDQVREWDEIQVPVRGGD